MIRHAYAISDKGLVRDNNEDNLYLGGRLINSDSRDAIRKGVTEEDLVALYAVCDGVGGEAFGEKASLLCATKMFKIHEELVARTVQRTSEADVTEDADDRNIQKIVNQNLQESGREIQGLVNPQNMHQYSGTTVAGIVFVSDKVHFFHIGDSRIYRIRDNKLERITTDHTEAERMVRMNMLTEEEARTSPKRHVLTRCLGVGNTDLEIEADFTMGQKALPGDIYILCSDGLTDMVSEEAITSALVCYDVPSASAMLVKEALENGGDDNITLLVVEVNATAPVSSDTKSESHIEKPAQRDQKKRYKLWLAPSIMTLLLVLTVLVIHFSNSQQEVAFVSETSQFALIDEQSPPAAAPMIQPTTQLTEATELPSTTTQTTDILITEQTTAPTAVPAQTSKPADITDQTIAPTTAPSQTTNDVPAEELPTTYTIQAKDGLMSISRKFYGSSSYYRYIMEKNDITDVDDIKIGQVLTIYPLEP